MECSRECAARGAMCAGGFNYKHQLARCELFFTPPITSILQVQDGCEYYSVCMSLLGRPTYVSSRAALGFIAVLFSRKLYKPTSNLRDYQEQRHKSYTTCQGLGRTR